MALTKVIGAGLGTLTGNADLDGAVDMASTLTVGGNTTLNGKFLIDGSNNDLMTFRTTGDTASQVLGLQFQNNSEAVTSQIFATGDNSTSHVLRIKSVGSIELHGGDIAVSGDATKMMKIDSSGVAQFRSSGISAGNQVFQVIDDGATLFQIRAEDGNVSFPQAGAGIYLGVTSGNSANLLDDYEEGTWTPALTGLTLSTALGNYTKIGQIVHWGFRVILPTTTANTHFNVTGLPFSHSLSSDFRFGGALIFANSNIGADVTCIVVNNGVQFYKNGSSFVEYGDYNGSDVRASGAYITTD